GRRGVGGFFAWYEQRARLREWLAALLCAGAGEVALTSGTSAGIAASALSYPWRPRDRVVLFTGEFPANVTPWQRAAALFNLEVAWVPVAAFADDPEAGLQRLEATLRGGRVRLVAVSAVQFQSGLR